MYIAGNGDYAEDIGSLEWTTTPPTVEGWYWVKEKGNGFTMAFVKYKRGHFEIWIDGEYRNDYEEYTHWLGPLPEPEPPQR